MYIIDIKTFNTISFSYFQSEQIARKYAQMRGYNIINEKGEIEGNIELSKSDAELLVKMLNDVNDIEQINTIKKGRPKTKTK